VRLGDVSSALFEICVHWLYFQRFPDADTGEDEELVKVWRVHHAWKNILTDWHVRLYVFRNENLSESLKSLTP
jgi:hypothetical protein